jgi:hypothetical protein
VLLRGGAEPVLEGEGAEEVKGAIDLRELVSCKIQRELSTRDADSEARKALKPRSCSAL